MILEFYNQVRPFQRMRSSARVIQTLRKLLGANVLFVLIWHIIWLYTNTKSK